MIAMDRRSLTAAVILGVGLLAFFPDLGQEVRLDGREIRHAEISREMAETGNYAVPCVLGTPYIDKPPLFNWIVAALFELTGRSDFAVARFPAALSALAVMVGIYILGKRWFTARVGLWGALMWPTFLLAGEWAGMSRGDMLMAALIFWAILFADLSAATSRPRASAALWCAASLLICGAVMSKGLQALIFFAIPVAGIWRARRRCWLPPAAFVLVTVLMVVAAIAGWSWAAEVRHPGHMRELLGYQFGKGLKLHPKRLYLYLDQIVLTTLPWSIFAVGMVICVVRRFCRAGYGVWAVPAVTLGVCLVILTLTPNKRAHYALPVLPMWAILLSAFMDAAASHPGPLGRPAGQGSEAAEGERLFRWSFGWPLRALLLCVTALLLAAPFYWVSHAHSGKGIGVALLIAAAAAAAYGVRASWRGSSLRAVQALLATVVLLSAVGRPLITHSDPPPPERNAITEIARAIPDNTPVGEYRVPYALLYFKMGRHVAFLHNEEDLRAFLQRGERYLIARPEDAPLVARWSGRPLREVGTWRLDEGDGISATVLAISP